MSIEVAGAVVMAWLVLSGWLAVALAAGVTIAYTETP